MVAKQASQFQQLKAQFVQHSDRQDDIVASLTSKLKAQSKQLEELREETTQSLTQQTADIETIDLRTKDQNHKFIQQANKHAEIMAKLSIKMEQNNNLIAN